MIGQATELRVQDLKIRILGFGSRGHGLGLQGLGSGFRVQGKEGGEEGRVYRF